MECRMMTVLTFNPGLKDEDPRVELYVIFFLD